MRGWAAAVAAVIAATAEQVGANATKGFSLRGKVVTRLTVLYNPTGVSNAHGGANTNSASVARATAGCFV